MFIDQRSTGRRPLHFHVPESMEDAAALLSQHAGQVRLGAGSTYLMLMAAHGETLPPHLVSLHRIPGLDGMSEGRLGSSVTLRRLERGSATGPQRALTMAASVTAGPSVRTLGTVGGNLGFAEGDLIPAMFALDATVHLDDGTTLPVTEYVPARPLDRILTAVSWQRRQEDGWSGVTVKLARRGMDWPVVTVSALLRIADDGEIVAATTAAQALAPEPTLLPAVDAVLIGSHGEPEALDYAAEAALHRMEIREDQEASAAYRRRVAPTVVRRALELAVAAGPDGRIGNTEARR